MDLYWTLDVRKRVWGLIDNIKTEVGGFGYAAIEEDEAGGKFIVWYDVFLVPQTVTSGEVDYETKDGSGVGYAIARAADDGVLGKDDHVWVSWHSHNSMKSFWSGVDEKCINDFGKSGMPMLMSLVGNHDHEYKARLDFFDVEHCGLIIPKVTMDDLTIDLDGDEPVDPFVEEIKAELDIYVEKKWSSSYVSQPYVKPHINGNGPKQTQKALTGPGFGLLGPGGDDDADETNRFINYGGRVYDLDNDLDWAELMESNP